ncbi:MAG: M14 family metallopeptidase [Betaproteobacteria bacterium]
MDVDSVFSSSYAQARTRFLEAARVAGAQLAHYEHPALKGPQGEALYLDVAVLGDPLAPNVMVVGCGTHGIEGFSGSAAQSAWMLDGGSARVAPGTAMVFLHAHNPWGFAHHQRVTEENVDLNRNFVDHSAGYPANPGYAVLHPGISPSRWDEESIRGVFAALEDFRQKNGEQAFSDAYNGGQYSHPDGVFFGGQRAQWSNDAFRTAVRKHVGHAKRAAIIDLHTGIGPYLDHVFLCFHAQGTPAYERARRWWGERAVNRQGSTHKALAVYRGLLVDAFQAELAQAETTAVVIEFGTRSRPEMQRANMSLRWLREHAKDHPEIARAVQADYVEAFYPSDPKWRAAVLAQSRVFLDQAAEGIGAGIAAG